MMLYNGDCLEIMPSIPDQSVNMILCDLPYGTTNCEWDKIIPFPELWEQYHRICKGAIVLTAAQPFSSIAVCSNLPSFKYEWIWEKSKATGFLNSKKRPLVAHESVLVFGNPNTYIPQMTLGMPYNKGIRKAQSSDDIYGSFNQKEIKSEGDRYPRSVIYFKTSESEGKTFHKTQKPIALMEYLIKTYSKEGDTVLDNCMGSGTTGVACKNLNRKFIGIEKDEKYFRIAQERITLTNARGKDND